MCPALPDFKARAARHQARLGETGALRLLEAGHAWHLALVLQAGGSILFPHTTLAVCGHQIAAAVHACLQSGARRVIVLGVLHALTEELAQARERIAEGADPANEPAWGLQGPGRPGRQDWHSEFSLDHFLFLLSGAGGRELKGARAIRRRGSIATPVAFGLGTHQSDRGLCLASEQTGRAGQI